MRVLPLLLALLLSPLLQAAGVSFSFQVGPNGQAPLAREIFARVRHPDGTERLLPAFHEGGQRWTVRAMPSQVGDYLFLGCLEGIGSSAQGLQAVLESAPAVTLKTPCNASQIIIPPATPNRFAHRDGRPYYPLGMNLAWPQGNDRLGYYRQSFDSFRAHGLNWTRIWCANWGGLNLDWAEDQDGGSPAPGEILPKVAELWDAIIEDATQKGIYLQFVFQHHGQYSLNVDSNWAFNPWNAARPGGFLTRPADFFTDERARRLTRQKYRYIVARWGWSPAIMAWELFNEVYQTEAYLNGDIASVAAWHNEMADYLRAIDPYGHLVTTSLNDLRSPIWERMDYLQPHLYAANVVDSVRHFHPSLQGITRPVFYGEVGDDAVLLPRPLLDSGAPILRFMWSSLMGESEYPAQAWYPERLLTPERLPELAALSRFIRHNRLASRTGLSPFTPAVESGSSVNLVIPAGHWWSRREPGFVQVAADGRLPSGLPLVPRAFVGSPDSIADGYSPSATVRADFPALTTARLRLNDVGGYGARLRVSINGRPVLNAEWPEFMKGDGKRPARPAEFSFGVPAGRNDITIENPGGPDWFDFHSLDLGLQVPALAAVGRRSRDFTMLWVWHRNGLFSPASPAEGRILIEDFPAGRWIASWWDTRRGTITAVASLQHGGGTLPLQTPALDGDAVVVLEPAP